MIAAERTAAVLLAAGRSVRFGDGDKLLAPFRDQLLIDHAAARLAAMPFLAHLAVIDRTQRDGAVAVRLDAHGFAPIANPAPTTGQDSSVRLGLAAALELGAEAALICLADMPNVSADHLAALLATASPTRSAISSAGKWRSPPTLITTAAARRILAEPGTPVRALLAQPVEVSAPEWMLADVDTRADLARLEGR